MATPYNIQVTPANSGLLHMKQTDAAAAKVTELLQKDLETHHVFFNASGFHNHIVHHLLALYGTGSNPEDLQAAYDDNKTYQVGAKDTNNDVVDDLRANWGTNSPKYFGKGEHYPDFLRFFQAEMERRGDWQDVVMEYLFKGDERSDDLLARLFSGIMHPIIQLMYGIEWQQPALVAEGLAHICVHGRPLGDFLEKAEQAAKSNGNDTNSWSLPEIMQGIRGNEKLLKSPQWSDDNKLYDGVLTRAFDEVVDLVSRVKVGEDQVEERTVEMLHTAAWVAAKAAQHPPYVVKFDFSLIHHLNSSVIFPTISQQSWIPAATKARILEWKIRVDIAQYIARGSPPLTIAELSAYKPCDSRSNDSKPLVSKPEDLLPRFHAIRDDGHTIKVVRSMMLARELSKPYVAKKAAWIRVPDDETWLKMLYMVLDGANSDGKEWVRAAGFEEAWEGIPEEK